jgi:transglutaminase-like putative cysteine protease
VAINAKHGKNVFRRLVGICLSGLVAAVANAAEVPTESKPVVAPPSAWVLPQFYDRQAAIQGAEAGADQKLLLLERQINVASNETFVHVIRQVCTLAGLQNGADIEINYNPGYQSLTMHWARLWRGVNHLERLDAGQIKVMRQERDLDQQLLNGEQTAMLVMDDVRVGDIVDYAYSVKGDNPVFNGRFSDTAIIQDSNPVDRLLVRVLCPVPRQIYSRPHGCSVQPAVARKTNSVECVWDLRHVPKCQNEDSLPVWFDPEPWVQMTEFKSWAEVNQWAQALFHNGSELSPALAGKIAEWKQIVGPEQQILTALRFVQDEIRYFGVEIGVSAEKPADPSTVFTRRFGDCKDKALLFVTLLRGLGIEAYPVLVNTRLRHTLDDWLPAADAFDHCIAVALLNGQAYWLDPTAGYQRGSLAAHYLPDYERGLVIAPLTAALTTIPQTAGLPLTTTTESFVLGGRTGPSSLKVVTVAEGRDADELRAMFANTKRSEIEKSFTHFYDGSYPGTTMAAPIEVQDDEAANRFQTTEFYTMDKAWIKSDSDGRYRCEFYPFSIAGVNKKPEDTRRSLPMGLSYPEHRVLLTEITVPASWNAWTFQKEIKNVNDPAFSFHKQVHRAGNKLILNYEYRTLADSVSPDRMSEYLENQDKVAKSCGNIFSWK